MFMLKYPELIEHLYELAGRYSPSEVVRRQIVEMTLMSAADHPDILFAIPIEKALFLLLSDAAASKLGLIPDATTTDDDAA